MRGAEDLAQLRRDFKQRLDQIPIDDPAAREWRRQKGEYFIDLSLGLDTSEPWPRWKMAAQFGSKNAPSSVRPHICQLYLDICDAHFSRFGRYPDNCVKGWVEDLQRSSSSSSEKDA